LFFLLFLPLTKHPPLSFPSSYFPSLFILLILFAYDLVLPLLLIVFPILHNITRTIFPSSLIMQPSSIVVECRMNFSLCWKTCTCCLFVYK
jgi:hypothetical protein